MRQQAQANFGNKIEIYVGLLVTVTVLLNNRHAQETRKQTAICAERWGCFEEKGTCNLAGYRLVVVVQYEYNFRKKMKISLTDTATGTGTGTGTASQWQCQTATASARH